MDKFRNRSFMVLLYEDDETHRNALKKIMVSYDYAGILHNKDITEEGELKNEKSEGEKVVDLIAYIKEYNGRLSITDFAVYCAKNGYWAEFRRSASILLKIIEEKNNYFDKARS